MLNKQRHITASDSGLSLLPTKDLRLGQDELRVTLSNKMTPSLFLNPGNYFQQRNLRVPVNFVSCIFTIVLPIYIKSSF